MNILDLRTDPHLLSKLLSVAGKKMSKQELFVQRVSFIFGQMNGGVPKEKISAILDMQEGRGK